MAYDVFTYLSDGFTVKTFHKCCPEGTVSVKLSDSILGNGGSHEVQYACCGGDVSLMCSCNSLDDCLGYDPYTGDYTGCYITSEAISSERYACSTGWIF